MILEHFEAFIKNSEEFYMKYFARMSSEIQVKIMSIYHEINS